MVNVFTSNKTQGKFNKKKISDIVEDQLKKRGVVDASLEIEIVGKNRMTRLNKDYMDRKGPTDVLSFPLPKISELDNHIGTIFLCRDIIKINSTKNSVSFQNEFERNLRHGIDHLVGIHHK
jgi:rRNA maturation RNase YbeY